MKEKQGLPFKIRHVTDEDIPLIFSSWLKSYRDAGKLANGVPNAIYYENHHKIIQKILKRSTVLIACDEKYPDQVMAYIVAERIEGVFVLHYVYTKFNFRKLGIAKALFNSFDHDIAHASCCTHVTKLGDKLMFKYGMIYHPYVILVDYNVPETKESEDVGTKS